jgi:hypothetical protein
MKIKKHNCIICNKITWTKIVFCKDCEQNAKDQENQLVCCDICNTNEKQKYIRYGYCHKCMKR